MILNSRSTFQIGKGRHARFKLKNLECVSVCSCVQQQQEKIRSATQIPSDSSMSGLESVPGQRGYIIMTADGAIQQSSGDLQNDEDTAAIIMHMINNSGKLMNALSNERRSFHRLSGGLEDVVRKCWDYFSVIACADGGTNVLFDEIDCGSGRYIPNFVCGDLDSARKEVVDFYQSKGSYVQQDSDEDNTDFTKTLVHLLSLKKSGKYQFSLVYVLNAIGGRFDQTLGCVNTLYSHCNDEIALYLLSEDSLICILEPGQHIIHVDSNLEEGHCGLVPFGEFCLSCTTTGLKWNLENHSMKFGGLISTNNLIKDKEVSIYNSNRLLWTMSHTLLDKFH